MKEIVDISAAPKFEEFKRVQNAKATDWIIKHIKWVVKISKLPTYWRREKILWKNLGLQEVADTNALKSMSLVKYRLAWVAPRQISAFNIKL